MEPSVGKAGARDGRALEVAVATRWSARVEGAEWPGDGTVEGGTSGAVVAEQGRDGGRCGAECRQGKNRGRNWVGGVSA